MLISLPQRHCTDVSMYVVITRQSDRLEAHYGTGFVEFCQAGSCNALRQTTAAEGSDVAITYTERDNGQGLRLMLHPGRGFAS